MVKVSRSSYVFSLNSIKTPNNFYILGVSKICALFLLFAALSPAFSISSLDLPVFFALLFPFVLYIAVNYLPKVQTNFLIPQSKTFLPYLYNELLSAKAVV